MEEETLELYLQGHSGEMIAGLKQGDLGLGSGG